MHFVKFWSKGVLRAFKSSGKVASNGIARAFKASWNEWKASMKETRLNWTILRLIAEAKPISFEDLGRYLGRGWPSSSARLPFADGSRSGQPVDAHSHR